MNTRWLRPDDLMAAHALSSAAGWNQTEGDWQRFLRLSPQGIFVTEADGRVIGTCAAFAFGSVGWIAMMLVDERWQGRGVGRGLMEAALDYLDRQNVVTVRLDATSMGRPLYEKLGFEAEYELSRYRGVSRPCESSPHVGGGKATIERLTAERWKDCFAFDRRKAGVERERLLRELFTAEPERSRVALVNGEVVGYITGRPGRLAYYLGPCVAVDDAGAALMTTALLEVSPGPMIVDVPAANQQANALTRSARLAIERTLLRMRRGPACQENASALWCSSGPEKG